MNSENMTSKKRKPKQQCQLKVELAVNFAALQGGEDTGKKSFAGSSRQENK